MITLEQTKQRFDQMVADSGKIITIDQVWEIDFDDPIYAMIIDEEGNQQLPGRMFSAIRKSDGMIVDYEFPCPATRTGNL